MSTSQIYDLSIWIRIRYRMLNIQTRIQTYLNSSKRIWSRIRSENMLTFSSLALTVNERPQHRQRRANSGATDAGPTRARNGDSLKSKVEHSSYSWVPIVQRASKQAVVQKAKGPILRPHKVAGMEARWFVSCVAVLLPPAAEGGGKSFSLICS
jgi:hypothetical protein